MPPLAVASGFVCLAHWAPLHKQHETASALLCETSNISSKSDSNIATRVHDHLPLTLVQANGHVHVLQY